MGLPLISQQLNCMQRLVRQIRLSDFGLDAG